jgi:hypothetical protein
MGPKDWRNLLIVAVAAALCFGGSFTCSTDGDDDDEIHGHVTINAIVP